MDNILMDRLGTSLGWTALHCVVEEESLDFIKQVIKQGEDINCKDKFGRTPLSLAAAHGKLEVLKLLIEEGADVNDGFPLQYACEKGHLSCVICLIQNGADVNLEKDKDYPLLISASKAHLEVVKTLIDNGADVAVVDENLETALHWACDNGNEELISFLIDAGCDIDARDKYQITPLSACLIRKENRPELVRLLLKKGASAQTVDKGDYTLLHHSEHPESTFELIKYGANVNRQNDDHETALYNTCFYRHYNCVKVLLEQNADPNIAASGGWTPLHVAAAHGDLAAVEELLGYNANPNAASAENIIPLHCAAVNGHVAVVEKLLDHGSFIDVPVVDLPDVNSNSPYFITRDCIQEGVTPMGLAVSNEHLEVCKLLMEHGARRNIPNLPQRELDILPIKREKDWPYSEVIEMVRSNDVEKMKNIQDHSAFGPVDLIGWTCLHHAVANKFYETSSELIKKGCSVNALDNFKRTPLSLAAASNDLQLLKLLLDSGADPNLGLPLHYAAEKRSTECLLALLQRNCRIVDVPNEKCSKSPVLVEAASSSKPDIVTILLEHGSNPNCSNIWGQTPLHHACQFGDLESVRALISHGANVNAVDSLQDTPLISAACSDNLEVIKILIQNKVNLDAEDGSAWTSLHRAIPGNPEGAAELIKAGANVNCYTSEGETPLHMAAENFQIFKILIENGADVTACSFGGWSVLHESAYCGNVDSVKELLRNEVNVNAATAENVLPLYIAAICGYEDVTKELLEHGSFVDPVILDVGVIRFETDNKFSYRNKYHVIGGNTPLIGAASNGHLEIVKLLHSYGASLGATNSVGNTPLHEAVLNGFETVVEFIIGLNVDVNCKTQKGKTVLDLAKEKSNETLVNMLDKCFK